MLRALPGLPEDLVLEMMEPPRRSYDPLLIQDPAIYRVEGVFMKYEDLSNKPKKKEHETNKPCLKALLMRVKPLKS
ncbi:hypothetical protein RJ640_009203 [Escallonia rubra]|uniref:Uncharacterized protein n=1 Tax=Escallonia rubra TaxID=112253 RepID=A0AA88U1T0_9ASTE|nr:hypothetical protein RJ640_009203 [Escallonia rubra]